jgi:hypothetical protein
MSQKRTTLVGAVPVPTTTGKGVRIFVGITPMGVPMTCERPMRRPRKYKGKPYIIKTSSHRYKKGQKQKS